MDDILFGELWLASGQSNMDMSHAGLIAEGEDGYIAFLNRIKDLNIRTFLIPGVAKGSSHLQSFPASGSFQMSQLFASSGQTIGVSVSISVLK